RTRYSARFASTIRPSRWSVTVCSSRACPMPPITPPCAWLSASRGLMIRPASDTPSMRRTRTMPSRASTATSAKIAPETPDEQQRQPFGEAVGVLADPLLIAGRCPAGQVLDHPPEQGREALVVLVAEAAAQVGVQVLHDPVGVGRRLRPGVGAVQLLH